MRCLLSHLLKAALPVLGQREEGGELFSNSQLRQPR